MSSTSTSDMPLIQRRCVTERDSAAHLPRAENSTPGDAGTSALRRSKPKPGSMKDNSDDEGERMSEESSSDDEDNVPLAQRVANSSGAPFTT
jgi:hypothetical protein